MEKLFIQKIARAFIIAVIFIIVAVLGFLIGGSVKYYLDVRKADKSVERFQGALEQPYKDDIYGGKTPEETWAMFLDALKKGDVDLASKYYRVGDQEKEKQFLLEEKQTDNLKLYLKQLSTPLQLDTSLPDFITANKTRAYYFYVMESPRTGDLIKHKKEFYLNPYTKVWKILY